MPPQAASKGEAGAQKVVPAFPLFDPLKRFPEMRSQFAHPGRAPRARYLATVPLVDAFHAASLPIRRKPAEPDDGLVSATVLARRLVALQSVLTDIDKQATRYARWQARAKFRRSLPPPKPLPSAAPPGGTGIVYPRHMRPPKPRPIRASGLRPGRPPGHRQKPSHEVDAILRECHALALAALETQARA